MEGGRLEEEAGGVVVEGGERADQQEVEGEVQKEEEGGRSQRR